MAWLFGFLRAGYMDRFHLSRRWPLHVIWQFIWFQYFNAQLIFQCRNGLMSGTKMLEPQYRPFFSFYSKNLPKTYFFWESQFFFRDAPSRSPENFPNTERLPTRKGYWDLWKTPILAFQKAITKKFISTETEVLIAPLLGARNFFLYTEGLLRCSSVHHLSFSTSLLHR